VKVHQTWFPNDEHPSWLSFEHAALLELFTFSDDDGDGRVVQGELSRAAAASPRGFVRMWRSACLAFPLGKDPWAEHYALQGQPIPADGNQLADSILKARVTAAVHRASAQGSESDTVATGRCVSALFWAEEALAELAGMHGILVNDVSWRRKLTHEWEALHKMQPKESLEAPSMRRSAEPVRQSKLEVQSAASSIEALETALFRWADPDATGHVLFADLLAGAARPGFISGVLLPNCLHSGALTRPDPYQPLTSGATPLTSVQLANISVGTRALTLQRGIIDIVRAGHNSRTHWSNWRKEGGTSTLQQHWQLSALFYLRAAFDCILRRREGTGNPEKTEQR
jgi:hypothetical protein